MILCGGRGRKGEGEREREREEREREGRGRGREGDKLSTKLTHTYELFMAQTRKHLSNHNSRCQMTNCSKQGSKCELDMNSHATIRELVSLLWEIKTHH